MSQGATMVVSQGGGRYPNGKLSRKDILRLLRAGRYSVCLTTGTVTSPHGRIVKPKFDRWGRYLVVELYDRRRGKRGSITVHALVWMKGTDSVPPPGFDIHHRNQNTTQNDFNNLYCLHKVDHGKLHADEDLIEPKRATDVAYDDDVPF